MSTKGELGKRFVEGALVRAADGLQKRRDDEYFEGQDRATSTCINIIKMRINKLHKAINEGKYLTNEEQFLMAQLNEIIMEIEDSLL